MANIHFILQGKGGVGKSYVSTLIAQFKKDKGNKILCLDTDPVNPTFSSYKSLDVKRVKIMDKEDINPRKFDDLIEYIINSDAQDIIIDNGASSFIPLSSYMLSHDIPNMLKEHKNKVYIHTIITGGQALRDTLSSFTQLSKKFTNQAMLFVWLNEFWGSVEYEGLDFKSMKAYQDHKKSVSGIITIPEIKKETFGADISRMLKGNQTFQEAIDDDKYKIMEKQRLKMTQKDLYEQMNNVLG